MMKTGVRCARVTCSGRRAHKTETYREWSWRPIWASNHTREPSGSAREIPQLQPRRLRQPPKKTAMALRHPDDESDMTAQAKSISSSPPRTSAGDGETLTSGGQCSLGAGGSQILQGEITCWWRDAKKKTTPVRQGCR